MRYKSKTCISYNIFLDIKVTIRSYFVAEYVSFLKDYAILIFPI